MIENLVGQLAWPIVVVLLVVVFYRQIKKVLEQLPGFVQRSRYGSSDGRDDVPVSDVWCPIGKVASCHLDETVLSVMKRMAENDFSILPILEKGSSRVIGVFSVKSVLRRCSKGQFTIGETLTVEQFLGKEPRELNVARLYFAARNEKLLLMRERFRNVAHNGRDFPLVFVTEHGDESEDLLGVVSVWDVVEKEA